MQRDVEVYNLQRVDPVTAEMAISTLFADLPFAAMPTVEADPDTQQLIVHGTQQQLERIQQLLQKMGEGSLQRRNAQRGSSLLRVIPLSGDATKTLREIERIWPQMRGNELQIVRPPNGASPAGPPDRPADDAPPAGDAPGDGANLVPDQSPAPDQSGQEDQREASLHTQPMRFVSAPLPQVAPTGQLPPANGVQADDELPPIVIIAGDGQLTVASRDLEALDQFEELLSTLQGGHG